MTVKRGEAAPAPAPVVQFKAIQRREGRFAGEKPFYRVTGEVDGEPREATLPQAAYDAAPKPQRYQIAVDALLTAQ